MSGGPPVAKEERVARLSARKERWWLHPSPRRQRLPQLPGLSQWLARRQCVASIALAKAAPDESADAPPVTFGISDNAILKKAAEVQSGTVIAVSAWAFYVKVL